jgi:beta-lactam-binding protein with PASTA domain
MKLTSLKVTAAERKEREKRFDKPMAVGGRDEYPYGLRITLDKATLKKLGLKLSSFDVEQCVEIKAYGHVKSLRSSQGTDFDSDTSLEIQITDLAIEPEDDDVSSALERGIKDANED